MKSASKIAPVNIKAAPRKIFILSLAFIAVAVAFFARPVLTSAGASPARVYVIGLNANHAMVASPMPVPAYSRFLTKALTAVNDSVSPILAQRQVPQPDTNWSLNAIGVGLGVSGTIGLGPIYNLTITPQLRLVFSDSKNPVYPD